MLNSEPLGVICGEEPEWKAVRERWRKALPLEFENILFFDAAASGDPRNAVKEAARAGIKSLLVAGVDIALLPKSGLKYFIYVDSTIFQQRWIHDHKPPTLRLKSKLKKIRDLAKAGHVFLCTSRLAAHGVAEEYRVQLEKIRIIPPPVETELSPESQTDAKPILQVLAAPETGALLKQEKEMQGVQWNELSTTNENSSIYETCDLLLLAESTTYPWLALNAMACGKPVIARNIGAASELVEDGVNGFILDNLEPQTITAVIARYEQDPGLLMKHGLAARDNVEKENSLQVHAKRLREAVESL